MKQITFNIENHSIAYNVNWAGIERVSINGNQVSKKLSLPNRKHRFVLDVYGKIEHFYIATKQSFGSGLITVQLFHNDVLIDEEQITFDFGGVNLSNKDSNNSMFTTGLMLVVFGIVFDWSRLFLLIGLLFLFCSFGIDTDKKKTNGDSSKADPNA